MMAVVSCGETMRTAIRQTKTVSHLVEGKAIRGRSGGVPVGGPRLACLESNRVSTPAFVLLGEYSGRPRLLESPNRMYIMSPDSALHQSG